MELFENAPNKCFYSERYSNSWQGRKARNCTIKWFKTIYLSFLIKCGGSRWAFAGKCAFAVEIIYSSAFVSGKNHLTVYRLRVKIVDRPAAPAAIE